MSGETINLSCAECNAIRPFSGGPPTWKCEVCGWELGTSSRTPASQTKKVGRILGDIFDALASLFKGFLALVFVGWVVVAVVEYFKSDQDKTAEQYHVLPSQVLVGPQPHGCAYNDAPLGDKHCHYEKDVNVVRECEQPNCKIRAVYVSWRKVSE